MTLSSDRSATRRFNLAFSSRSCFSSRASRGHPAVGLLPAVVRLLGDPDVATDVADGDAALRLLQDGGDLLDGKALLLHGSLLARRAGLCRSPHVPDGPKNPEPLTSPV